MRLFLALPLLLAAAISLAGDEKPIPAPPDKLYHRELSTDWLWAIERLRILPRPGEIRTTEGLTAGVTDIYELQPAETAQIEKALTEYDAALLQKAAKWETEMKELRAEYEAKVIAALPQTKQVEAKKVLDFTHAKWVTPSEREGKFRNEFAARAKAFREATKDKSLEDKADGQETIARWVKAERAKLRKEDVDLIYAVRACLSPDAAEKLDKFDRYKLAQAQAQEQQPEPAKKDNANK
jgi:hypothetical protein